MARVSVIVPTYNRARFLPRALETVFSQTYRDFEVIVVDDGSTDNTPEIMEQFADRVKYIRKENGGSASARNRGIEESKGEYIAFLDSDDYWTPEKLAEQVKVLDTYPKVGIVYGRMPIVNEKGERLGTKPGGISGRNFKELIEVWGDLPTSTVMTRRECFNRAGMFDTSLITMQDIDMWLRIARFYDLHEIEGKVLAYYFRHSEQATHDNIKVYSDLVSVDRKILRNFTDIPVKSVTKRLSKNLYKLSRIYYNQQYYPEAFKNLSGALNLNPAIGLSFITEGDSVWQKILKLFKPYGYFIFCLTKNFLAKLSFYRPKAAQ